MVYQYKNYLFSHIRCLLLATATCLLISCNQSTKQEDKNVKINAANDVKKINNAGSKEIIVFFGNSLTAGYGLEPQDAYPALIQKKLDSLGFNYHVVNAGLSGETTASGKNRIGWVLKQPVDIFVLELGGNDGLRGLPLKETQQNLLDLIDSVKLKKPAVTIVLAGMQIPPNMGTDYTAKFQKIFPEVAKKADVHLIPFLLEGVGGEADLNLPDGIHPNEKGQKIVAENVWAVLKDIIFNNR